MVERLGEMRKGRREDWERDQRLQPYWFISILYWNLTKNIYFCRPSDFPFQNLPISVSHISNSASHPKLPVFTGFSEVLAVFCLLLNYYIDWRIFIAFYTTLFTQNPEIMLPCCIKPKFPFTGGKSRALLLSKKIVHILYWDCIKLFKITYKILILVVIDTETKTIRLESLEDRDREKRERYEREWRWQFEEEEEHHHLPLLVVQLPQGTAVLLRRHEFPTRFCIKALQQWSIDVKNEVVGVAKWRIIRTIW